jgi:hypothetical protein
MVPDPLAPRAIIGGRGRTRGCPRPTGRVLPWRGSVHPGRTRTSAQSHRWGPSFLAQLLKHPEWTPSASSELAVERPEVLSEQFGLFQGGEVPAARNLRPALDVAEESLCRLSGKRAVSGEILGEKGLDPWIITYPPSSNDQPSWAPIHSFSASEKVEGSSCAALS